MRISTVAILSVPVLLLGCSSASTGESASGGGSVGGNSDAPADGSGSVGGESGGEPSVLGPPGEPLRLSDDAVVIVGVTADGNVIYRSSEGLTAVALVEDASPQVISEAGGTVLIRDDIVFQWADVDWETNLGDLTIWTAEHGPQHVGITLFGEDTVAASRDGSRFLYVTGVEEETADLMIASTDLADNVPLIEDIGRGTQETCRASFGFAGDAPVAAWCTVGSTEARLERYEGGEPVEIATGVRPLWSSDEAGERLFYIGVDSRAAYWDGEGNHPIDRSVSWGMLVPDGSTVLYTVSDQLRRSPLPDVNPTPIVVNDFVARTDWSPDFQYALYSTEITYEGGTRRDLFLTPTQTFNPEPEILVADPEAVVSRSAFTSNGEWALYLTDVGDHGSGILNMKPVSGGAIRTIENVDTVVAAADGKIVFSDNRSDPEQYPITADLKVVDPAGGEPQLLTTGTTDGRAFFLTPDENAAVYVMPRGEDPEADVQGLYVQTLP